jgi:hypothetical protein
MTSRPGTADTGRLDLVASGAAAMKCVRCHHDGCVDVRPIGARVHFFCRLCKHQWWRKPDKD